MSLAGLPEADLAALREAGCPVDDPARAKDWLALRALAASRASPAPDPDARWREGRARQVQTRAEREAHELAVLRERWVEREEARLAWSLEVARARDAFLGGFPERVANQPADVIRREVMRILDGLARGCPEGGG